MSPNKKRTVKKKLKALARPAIREEFAFLGNLLTGEVQADLNGNVYITYSNLQIDIVFNQTVPLIKGRPVAIWFHEGVRQIRRFISPWVQKPPANVANHAPSHGWAGWDPVEITPEQFLALLVRPILGTMSVNLFGGEFYVNELDHVKSNEVIDLSSYVPATGAQWGIIEIDEDGVSYVTLGSAVAGRDLQERETIPQPTAGRKRICAIKFYAGQTEVVKTLTDTDIIDLRFSGLASGGGMPILDPDRVVVTDGSGNVVTVPDFLWDGINRRLQMGDYSLPSVFSAFTDMFIQIAEGVSPTHNFVSYGDGFAPAVNMFKSGGTEASPTGVLQGSVLGRFRVRPYDGSGFPNYFGELRWVAAEDHDDTHHGVELQVFTTELNGSNAPALNFTFEANGDFNLENPAATYNINGVPHTHAGTLVFTEVEIDFGSETSAYKSFVITDAGISPGDTIIVMQSGETPTDKMDDEIEFSSLSLVAVAGTGDFTLHVHPLGGFVYGKFKILYAKG